MKTYTYLILILSLTTSSAFASPYNTIETQFANWVRTSCSSASGSERQELTMTVANKISGIYWRRTATPGTPSASRLEQWAFALLEQAKFTVVTFNSNDHTKTVSPKDICSATDKELKNLVNTPYFDNEMSEMMYFQDISDSFVEGSDRKGIVSETLSR